ncbi:MULTISPECIES: SGNH/GDSL hydrolase family protein [unclassified Pseudomonas]|uniref:SGNH/GDSL hydrolase family protein n=1 Tax=unclassified Pseudomonas TaxID=196821 RepID=UPI0030DBDDF8
MPDASGVAKNSSAEQSGRSSTLMTSFGLNERNRENIGSTGFTEKRTADMNYESEDALAKIDLAIWQHDQPAQKQVEGVTGFFFGSNGVDVVAQGDSWFDYLPGVDIIKWLKLTSGYKIKSFASGGDTLENMVYGTEIKDGAWTRPRPEFEDVLAEIKRIKPAFFLFSGAGNDIAGDEFASFLNHADASPASLVRTDYVNDTVDRVFRNAYEDMIKRVKAAHPKIKIIFHGYGRAIPTGKGVVNIGNYRFIGPWLRPSLTRKNIMNPQVQRQIVTDFIDQLNTMLKSVADAHPDVYFIDLRNLINDDDWINELHLNALAYKRMAKQFEDKMDSLLTSKQALVKAQAKTTALEAFNRLEQSLATVQAGIQVPVQNQWAPVQAPPAVKRTPRSRQVAPTKGKTATKRKAK